MLTGHRGYEAEDVSETLAAVLTREVDWTKLPVSTPPRLTALLRDCLVRDPKQRLRDMGEARRVLDQLITGQSSTGVVVPSAPSVAASSPAAAPVWRRALPWAVALVATIGALVVVCQSRGAKPDASPVTRARTPFKDKALMVDVSRDGTKFVYCRAWGDQGVHLELRHTDQFEGQALPGTEGGVIGVFSPAGDWVAFSTFDGKIKKTPAAGGPAITLTDGFFSNGATWGDDDTIVYNGATGLMRVPASGGTPESLTTVAKDKGEVAHVRPQFLRGRAQLLFTVTSVSADPQFAVVDLKKGGYRIIARGGDNGRYVPTGHLVSARSGTLFALPFDLDRLTPSGPEAPVIEGVSSLGLVADDADYALSQTGLLVYVESSTQEGTTLTWRDRHGVETPLPGQLTRRWGTGTLSPDGRRVADAMAADKGSDIWVVELSRGTPIRLTFGGSNDNPIWTPDGRTIVYNGSLDGKRGLCKVAADGSGQPQLILPVTETAVPTSFTPDGKTLFFHQRGPGGKPRIMVVDVSGASGMGAPRPFRESSAADFDAQVSPDGKWLAFSSTESGGTELFVLPVSGPGAKVQISSGGALRPRWSPGGRELLFWESNGNATLLSSAVQLSPFSTAPPQKLFTALAGSTWGVAPDGQHFLLEVVQNGSVIATVTNWFDELRRRAPVKK